MINFCTYFDKNYMSKGKVLINSLRKYGNSHIYILAFDETVANECFADDTTIIRLSDIEMAYPELLNHKGDRQLKEYYATLSPILPLYIFDTFGVETVFYSDADIMFFEDPQEIVDVFGDKSLMVVDHGIEPPRSKVRFNVGILGYRNDEHCREFLHWWKERCFEWCEWRTMPDGRCADQGYLNVIYDEPDRFKNTLICPQPGINMGPWNVGLHQLREGVVIDGQYKLVCYHYHEFKLNFKNGKPVSYFPTGWKHTALDKILVYDPYFKALREVYDEKS